MKVITNILYSYLICYVSSKNTVFLLNKLFNWLDIMFQNYKRVNLVIKYCLAKEKIFSIDEKSYVIY